MREPPHTFRTVRLTATKIAPPDLPDCQRFYSDPAVMATLSADGRVWPAHESADLFERHIQHWHDHGFGTWIFRDPEDVFVGRGGLRQIDVGSGPESERYSGGASEVWGRGLATEMACELIRVAFEDMACEALIGFTLPTNAASQRILEKCGFERDGQIRHAGLVHHLYRLPSPFVSVAGAI